VSPELRAPTEADIPELVRLMSEGWPEPADEDLVRRQWTAPGFDVADDARLDGAGCAIVEELGEERVWIDLRGRPSVELIDWAEERARQRGRRVFSGGWSSNEPVLRELERRGYRTVRHSQRMMIDLAEPTPDPVWPDGVQVRTFRPGDERSLYDAQQESFLDSWEPIEESYDEWSHWMLEGPAFVPDLWFLAVEEAEVAGFAICHPRAAVPGLGWVRLLGVRRPWRRRGLGRALLLHAFGELRRRGFERAGLGVDSESVTGANLLYEQAGMHVAARFDIYEKMSA
jgi:ribosomal protein S18 acetylase RimI-like enzyme